MSESVTATGVVVREPGEGPATWAMGSLFEHLVGPEHTEGLLGVSLVTNLAAGMTGEPLNHDEVLQAGRDSAARMGSLLARVLSRI